MNFSNPDFIARKVLKPNDGPFVPQMRPAAEALRRQEAPRVPVPAQSPKSAPEPEKAAPVASKPKPAAVAKKAKSKEDISRKAMSETLLKVIGLYPGRTSEELFKLLKSGPYNIRPDTSGRGVGQFCKYLAERGILRSDMGARNRLLWYPVEQNPAPASAEKLSGKPDVAATPTADRYFVCEPDEPAKAMVKAPAEAVKPSAVELVDHPDHYNQHPAGIECIDVIEHFNFNIGAAIKHCWRHGRKPGNDALTDLKKARWYIEREIARLGR